MDETGRPLAMPNIGTISKNILGKSKLGQYLTFLNLGCLHPVACVRSGDGGFYIRLRNVIIVG
jgi:hypothetical protein